MIPIEIRKVIVKNREKGIPQKETSRILGVSISAIGDIIHRYDETGSVEPSYPGRQPKITKEQTEEMIRLVNEQPDITLEEIIEKLDLPIKKSRVSKILIDHGFSFKKEAGSCKRAKA